MYRKSLLEKSKNISIRLGISEKLNADLEKLKVHKLEPFTGKFNSLRFILTYVEDNYYIC